MELDKPQRVLIAYEYRLFGEAVVRVLEDEPEVEIVGCVPVEEVLFEPSLRACAMLIIVECDATNLLAETWGKLLFNCTKGTRVIFLDRSEAKISTWTCGGNSQNVGIHDLLRSAVKD